MIVRINLNEAQKNNPNMYFIHAFDLKSDKKIHKDELKELE